MPKNIIAGNWKMNLNLPEGNSLLEEINNYCAGKKVASEVVVAPPYIFLARAAHYPNIGWAAQNCSEQQSGAFTGEISAAMIASTGARYVLCGHSERREYYGDGENLPAKMSRILENDMIPILCVGEKLEQRQQGKQVEIVEEQLRSALANISGEQAEKLVIAYEPVWAIGTGETATAAQAQEMHAHIRQWLGQRFDAARAKEISILYGGSVKPENAAEIFSQADVNGGLIGGASLKAASFCELIELGDKHL